MRYERNAGFVPLRADAAPAAAAIQGGAHASGNAPANGSGPANGGRQEGRNLRDALGDTDNPLYRIPVFLSYATPYNALQAAFLAQVIEENRANLLFPRTLGRSDSYTETPLTSIRRMILSSYGLLAVAFRRAFVPEAIARPGSPREETFENFWLSSPYLQIEPSMAYQQGLPIMLMLENGVSQNAVFGGIFEQGAAPFTIISFSADNQQQIDDFFQSVFWRETFLDWVGEVRACYTKLTEPPNGCECS